MAFVMDPPDEETQKLLENMAHSPALRPADQKYVRFYARPKLNRLKSWGGEVVRMVEGKEVKEFVKGEGRPIFDAREYVEIFSPGDKDTIIDRPVRPVDRYAWKERYVSFRDGKAQDASGLPLSEWGGISPERALELGHFRLKTVEQLAEVPDGNLGNLGPRARAEREKAKAYLAAMSDTAAPVAELKAENEALKARLDALEAMAQAPRRKRGRPPGKAKGESHGEVRVEGAAGAEA